MSRYFTAAASLFASFHALTSQEMMGQETLENLCGLKQRNFKVTLTRKIDR